MNGDGGGGGGSFTANAYFTFHLVKPHLTIFGGAGFPHEIIDSCESASMATLYFHVLF